MGFTQSYTYFAWRNANWELESYLTELTRTEVADFFRPNLWPNTPDILTEQLQGGGPASFRPPGAGRHPGRQLRHLRPRLRAARARSPPAGSEEYRHSEKYAVRHWDLDRPDSLVDVVARLNRIRRAHPALAVQRLASVPRERRTSSSWCTRSHVPRQERRSTGLRDGRDTVVVVVNLDPDHRQSGWVDLDLGALGIETGRPIDMHDLLTDARYQWEGARNFVILDPQVGPVLTCSRLGPSPASPEPAPSPPEVAR